MCIHIRLRSIFRFQEFQLVHCHYWKAPHIAMRLTPWPGANGQIHSGRCTNRAVVQCFQNTEHCNPKRSKMRELSVHVSTVYYVNRIIYLENMQNSFDADVLERAVAAVWGSKAGPASNPRNLTACPLKFAHGVNDVCFVYCISQPELMVRYILPWTLKCRNLRRCPSLDTGRIKDIPQPHTLWRFESLVFIFEKPCRCSWKSMRCPSICVQSSVPGQRKSPACRLPGFFGWHQWTRNHRTIKSKTMWGKVNDFSTWQHHS